MSAGRVAGEVNAIRIPVEFRCALIAPANASPNLVSEYGQVAVDVFDIVKIGNPHMEAGVDESFGDKGVVAGSSARPGTAVNEDENGCFGWLTRGIE